jgi:hypothetical protein
MNRHACSVLLGMVLVAVSASGQNTFPSSGNAGIGTTAPQDLLDVRGNTLIYNGTLLLGGPANLWGVNGSTQLNGNYASPVAGRLSFGDGSGWKFSIGRFGPVDLVTFQDNGNVGIGTTTPGTKLEINGNLKLSAGSGASLTFADGTVQSTAYTGITCGGDYAESIDVTGDHVNYAPGDVLLIDPDAPGKFVKSAEPYSTRVLGVYSTKPGTLGRRQTTPKSPDEVPMAMVGIVPIKVSAENGPIRPGDLLVSASTPGYAMKGTDRPRMLGAIIGKAMGSLDSGTGLIEAGITLQ